MKSQTVKRKLPNGKADNSTASSKKKLIKFDATLNEEIQSDSENELENHYDESDEIESEEEETVQEKKIRMAKEFIEELRKQKEEDANDKGDSDFFVSRKLEEDLQSKTGKLRKELAQKYKSGEIKHQFKGHRLTVTCAVVSHDSKFVFSGSKDASIIKWNCETGLREKTIKKRLLNKNPTEKGHLNEILCMAISSDFEFLATSGKDKSIKLWNPTTLEFIYNFEGHRDAVSGLVFRQNSHQLFSSSYDRSVKVWDCDQLVYVETLFGHQDKILSIDCLNKERCITCGSRDRSLRVWKIIEESQLLFNGTHYDSIDCVTLVNEENFISGSNDGSLGIWNINKKKPLGTVKNAHKTEGSTNSEASGWITAVSAYHNTDLLASGSDDGFIRVWKHAESSNKLIEQFNIPIDGVVNDLKFSKDGNYLIAAIGQENRLGRWATIKKAKNCTLFIKLNRDDQETK